MAKERHYKAFRQLTNFSTRVAECSIMLNKCCQAGDGQPHVGEIALAEGIPHRSMRYRKDGRGLPIMPDPSRNPLIFIKIKDVCSSGNPIEVLGMPDSGMNKNLCGIKFAKENNLVVNKNETVKMYAANKMQLTCEGAAKILVNYF